MRENSKLAYSEVYAIINLLEDEYLDKIPKKIINFFDEEREKNYIPVIDVNVSLLKQNLQRETMILLTILKLNYWCNSEEEKQEIRDNLYRNQQIKIKKQKELEEQYNPNNLFKNRTKTNTSNDSPSNLEMIEYKKQNFIQVLLNKIMNFFKRRNP